MNISSILGKYLDQDPQPFHVAVFRAVDKNGNILDSSSCGTLNVDGSGPPVTEDSIFWVASMSKIITTAAIMVCIENGSITLDTDIGQFLPELAAPNILVGFEDGENGKPITRPAQKKLTLRRLLTHTSGFAYDVVNPLLRRWKQYHSQTPGLTTGSIEDYRYPLVFEPGESWAYGPGLDWAGRVVEAVTSLTLDAFIQEQICARLDLTATTFYPLKVGDYEQRKVEFAFRDQETGKLSSGADPYPLSAQDCLGGIGMYTTPREFTKLLGTLLAGGGPILKPESVQTIFSSQIENDEVTEYCNKLLNHPMGEGMRRALTTGTSVQQGLSLFKNLNTEDGRRAVGSVSWMGMPNCVWWIDPDTGVAASIFFQSLPPVDKTLARIQEEMEIEFYKPL